MLPLLFTGCSTDDYKFGDIITPSNLKISYEIVGADTENPNGDGTGFVMFTATADNALSYQFHFGDSKSKVAPSGKIKYRYTKVGVNEFIATVNAVGTGGTIASTSVKVRIYSSFTDVEAENLLSGEKIGDSKSWYWAADKAVHVGLGPQEADYGNGEFAYASWWNSIATFDKEKACMYDNELVFTRTADGITFEQKGTHVFVPGAYASVLGVDGDVCHSSDIIPTMKGVKKVSFFPSSSKAAIEGSYNDKPYRKTSFDLSDGGFMGWYVGASTYDIISLSETTLIVRVMQPNSEFAWYHIFTSTKPVEKSDEYTNLVWSDEFDTDGAPDQSKWTYDIGAGGWGNEELQHYTNRTENVVIEGGVLKIKAKKETFEQATYTSARLKSQGLYSFKYGKVEVKAKLPKSQGTWPAIWMLGDSFSTVGWPKCGEIDIMEQKGDDKSITLGTTHWFDTTTNANANYGLTTPVANSSSEFHIYAMVWTEDAIKLFVDDVMFYEMKNTASLPFNDKFFFILNVAMGGSLGGAVASDFTEDTMEIDYIRVYQ